MTEEKDAGFSHNIPDRWTLFRDIISLQVKLLVDGFRDFILVPVSLVAGIVSLVQPGDRPGTGFYRLLRAGRDTERWINLFSAADRLADLPDNGHGRPTEDIDALIRKMEDMAVNEYRAGALSRQAKERFDQVMKSVRNRTGRSEKE